MGLIPSDFGIFYMRISPSHIKVSWSAANHTGGYHDLLPVNSLWWAVLAFLPSSLLRQGFGYLLCSWLRSHSIQWWSQTYLYVFAGTDLHIQVVLSYPELVGSEGIIIVSPYQVSSYHRVPHSPLHYSLHALRVILITELPEHWENSPRIPVSNGSIFLYQFQDYSLCLDSTLTKYAPPQVEKHPCI